MARRPRDRQCRHRAGPPGRGLQEHDARFATDVDKAARRANLSGARGTQTYSDRDIIVALRAVAAGLGRVPSAKEYALLAGSPE